MIIGKLDNDVTGFDVIAWKKNSLTLLCNNVII